MISYILTGPLNVTLYVLCLASIGYSIVMEVRARRQQTAVTEDEVGEESA